MFHRAGDIELELEREELSGKKEEGEARVRYSRQWPQHRQRHREVWKLGVLCGQSACGQLEKRLALCSWDLVCEY
jgi:ParB-like chromosome segregation protein Spo0J